MLRVAQCDHLAHLGEMGVHLAAGVVQRRHRRVIVALGALLLGGAGTAFGVASLGPDPSLIPVRLVVESVQPLAIAPQVEALDNHPFSLFRSEQTRSTDSAESLFGGGDDALPRISCTIPEIVRAMRIGEPIYFDDGNIGGIIEERTAEGVMVRVTKAKPGGTKLRSQRGINVPETSVVLPAISAADLQDLETVIPFADLIGLSFAQQPEDVLALHQALDKHDAHHVGVILKIETRRGFAELLDRWPAGAYSWPPSVAAAARRLPIAGLYHATSAVIDRKPDFEDRVRLLDGRAGRPCWRTTSPVAGREPAHQPGPTHHGHRPTTPRHRGPRLLPAQASRRKEDDGGTALPEATHLRRHLQTAHCRRRTSNGGTSVRGRGGSGRALRGVSRIQRGRPAPAHRHFGSATSRTRNTDATTGQPSPEDPEEQHPSTRCLTQRGAR